MYRENARFSFLLGCAYLYRGDTGGAYSCFRRAQSLDFRNADAAFALAAVLIRRGETDKAVQLYIDILERSPGHRRAARALEYLRKGADASGTDQPDARARRLLYPVPPVSAKPFALAVSAVSFMVFLYLAVPVASRVLSAAKRERPGVSDILLSEDERASPVGSAGEFEIVLTEKEALAAFEKAKSLFGEYRDEAALVEINRLLLSNATRQVKAKAEALALYVREPTFLSMPDAFSYEEVKANRRLFEGVAVLWKGMPANVVQGTSSASFDFLVGYHDMKKLEGIVPVRVAFPIKIDAERPLEVLGRIRSGDAASGGFYVECVAIHQ